MSLLDTLLLQEDQQDLWNPDIAGLKLWPFLRFRAYQAYIERRSQFETAHKIRQLARLAPGTWGGHWHTLRRAVVAPRQADYSALFFVSARPSAVDIHRYYYAPLPRPLVMETTWNGARTPRSQHYGGSFILEDTFLLWAALRARLIRLPGGQTRLIREYAGHVCQVFDLPDAAPRFASHLANSLRMAAVLRHAFSRCLLPRLREKVALIQSASYMDRYAVLTRLLHDNGFLVVEAQHGTVYDTHPAYNFSPQLLADANHPGRAYLPDTLLGFGDYWLRQIRTPSRPVVIGFPRLSQTVQNLTPPATGEILIISQGVVTGRMTSLAARLSAALPDRRIIFKLHPNEIPFRERYQDLLALPNVVVRESEDIYPLIARSAIIIGAFSTAIYEAAAFPNKRIFILKLENDYMPDAAGTKFSTPDELLDLIRDESQGSPGSSSPDDLWAPDWQARLHNFWSQTLPGIQLESGVQNA